MEAGRKRGQREREQPDVTHRLRTLVHWYHADDYPCTDRGPTRGADAQSPQSLAEYLDLTLGDLLEGIVLHAFEGSPPFGEDTLEVIRQLKDVYGLVLMASDAHTLGEAESGET